MSNQRVLRALHLTALLRRPRRWFVVRLVLVLGLALLTLPLLDTTATADDTTTDPASSTAATDATSAAPAADPPSGPSDQPSAQPSEQPSAQPSEPGTTPATTSTTAARSTARPLARTDSAVPTVATDVCTQGGKVDSFMQYSNKDLDGPGVWANGNMNANKANLVEGGFVWQRVILKSLEAGPQKLVLTYDVKAGDTWAYDRLDQLSLSTGSGPAVSVADPNGPVATATITWTMPAAGGTTLIFGAHIASELDHGPGAGAGSINGSPYHVSLQSLNCRTTGQMDNQVMAAAVQSALLTVVKVANPADGTDFHFAITPGGSASTFLLDDDDSTDSTYPDRVTYRVPPGGYHVAETDIPAAWHLSNVSCSRGGTRNGDAVDVTLADDAAVTCTFTDTKSTYQDLTVSDPVTASYARDYDWTIDKSVSGNSRLDVPEGTSAQAGYDVVVTPSAAKDGDFAVSGTITLTNPNAGTMSGVTLRASVPGATCVVDGAGGALDVPPGSHSYAYSCAMPPGTTASTAGASTVTATWSAGDYYGSSGSASSTTAFDFASVTPTTTDASVTVTDDHLDLGTLPGGNVVHAVDGPRTFGYRLGWEGVAGRCTPYTNTATLTEPDGDTQTDDATVTVCVGSDLTVSKNAVTGLHRTYAYRIDKTTSTPLLSADPATGLATAHYTVTVTDGAYADSAWTMTGVITVTNPNAWEAVTLSRLTDVYDGGGSCVVDTGAGLAVPAGGSRAFDYTCTFDGLPQYDGTNTATATWDAATYVTPTGSARGTRDVAAADWSTTMVDRTITVRDDKTDPAHPVTLGQVTWSGAGARHVFGYDLVLQGSPGRCTPYTNIAWIVETGDSSSVDVSVCLAADLTVTKTVRASYDLTYLWQIDKAVDRTRVTTTERRLGALRLHRHRDPVRLAGRRLGDGR